MSLPHRRRRGMNDYVHSSEDVERQFTAMMDTYLDSWIPADALPHMPRNGQQRAAVGSQLEIQALESQRHNLNSDANLDQHALALSSFTSPSGATDLDGDMFGLGLDVPNLELDAPAGQSSMLTAMSSGDATGTTGGNAPIPGTEGVRKQKILEKNRRAQKRFREKQKAKMADMEVALQDLQSTMSTVVKEKTCLKRQNESLLKALELRQNQIEALTEVAKVNPNGANEAGLGEPMRTATGV